MTARAENRLLAVKQWRLEFFKTVNYK